MWRGASLLRRKPLKKRQESPRRRPQKLADYGAMSSEERTFYILLDLCIVLVSFWNRWEQSESLSSIVHCVIALLDYICTKLFQCTSLDTAGSMVVLFEFAASNFFGSITARYHSLQWLGIFHLLSQIPKKLWRRLVQFGLFYFPSQIDVVMQVENIPVSLDMAQKGCRSTVDKPSYYGKLFCPPIFTKWIFDRAPHESFNG